MCSKILKGLVVMNFLSIILLLIVIVMLVVIAILIKPVYKSIKNTETNKNRKLVIISMASLVCLLLFTYTVIEIRSVDSGYHHSTGQYMIYGISGIEVKKRSFDMEDPVSVSFSYGHTNSRIVKKIEKI